MTYDRVADNLEKISEELDRLRGAEGPWGLNDPDEKSHKILSEAISEIKKLRDSFREDALVDDEIHRQAKIIRRKYKKEGGKPPKEFVINELSEAYGELVMEGWFIQKKWREKNPSDWDRDSYDYALAAINMTISFLETGEYKPAIYHN